MLKRIRDDGKRLFVLRVAAEQAWTVVVPLSILLISLTTAGLARPKIDVIVMKNGDRLTCEIKKLEFGQLHIKTRYTLGTVVVNWEEVERVESPQTFVLETTSGAYFTGLLKKESDSATSTQGNVVVVEGRRSTPVLAADVVAVEQIGESFLRRLGLSIDYGFNFARANNQTQSTLQSNLQYRTETDLANVSVNSLFAGQRDGTDTNRHQSSLTYQRGLGNSRKWFAAGLADFLNNDQQRLDLRTTLGGGLGRKLIHSNRNTLSVSGGVAWNRERFSPETMRLEANSAEGLVDVRYSTFRFDSSELITHLTVFPSLTDTGRVRLSFDASVYWDIIGDLYWRMSFWDNFDSRPPETTARNDFGVGTSIGWSF